MAYIDAKRKDHFQHLCTEHSFAPVFEEQPPNRVKR